MDSFIPNTSEVVDHVGPRSPISIKVFQDKYSRGGENWRAMTGRVAAALADNEAHRLAIKTMLREMKALHGGRILSGAGSSLVVTLLNCYHSGVIEDTLCGEGGILDRLKEVGATLQQGGGVGINFSTLRPKGAKIKTLDSESSGAVSFMELSDVLGRVIQSAGSRRGALMGTMRCDHPDIEEFIGCKANTNAFTAFNITVLVTNAFLNAVKEGLPWDLVFDGVVYKTVDARALWDSIMRMTWQHAEPGVGFIDRINEMNNLYYCEKIIGFNPCGEIPLPPHGACLLGSLNLTKFVKWDGSKRYLDFDDFKATVLTFYASMDNVIDVTRYPLPAQQVESESKRRLGMGTKGNANAFEAMGLPYGSPEYIEMQDRVYRVMVETVYRASADRAVERGSFPLYDRDQYLNSKFIQQTLSDETIGYIAKRGMRNSHLTAIAPTGTISLLADNVSSGIEPVFAHSYERDIRFKGGQKQTVVVQDYGVSHFGVYGRRADEISAEDHVRVAAAAQRFMDAAVSKTCNVGRDVPWADFKNLYMLADELGLKGITTYREGNREGVLRTTEGAACTIDPLTGSKTCS